LKNIKFFNIDTYQLLIQKYRIKGRKYARKQVYFYSLNKFNFAKQQIGLILWKHI